MYDAHKRLINPELGLYDPRTGEFVGNPDKVSPFQSEKEFTTGPGVVTDSVGNIYRPQWYPARMTIPQDKGARVEQTIEIGQFDYLGTIISWEQTFPCQQVEGETIPPCLINQRDGRFFFDFRISDRNMFSQSAYIRALIGDAVQGRPMPLPAPLKLARKETITIEVENDIQRTDVCADDRRLHIVFLGLRKYEGE